MSKCRFFLFLLFELHLIFVDSYLSSFLENSRTCFFQIWICSTFLLSHFWDLLDFVDLVFPSSPSLVHLISWCGVLHNFLCFLFNFSSFQLALWRFWLFCGLWLGGNICLLLIWQQITKSRWASTENAFLLRGFAFAALRNCRIIGGWGLFCFHIRMTVLFLA